MSDLILVIGSKNYSSWSLRPWLALKQAGVEFSELQIALDTVNTYDTIRRYSPSGKVPVLYHGQIKVWESLAICLYIAEQFAPQLWPVDLKARAMAFSISHEMHAGFYHLQQNMPMNCRERHPGEGMTANVQADIDRILAIWQECRQEFGAGGNFLFGEFTIADAMFAPVVSRFTTYGVKLDPICQVYVDTIWNLPAMQEWVQSACDEPETLPLFL